MDPILFSVAYSFDRTGFGDFPHLIFHLLLDFMILVFSLYRINHIKMDGEPLNINLA